MITIVEEKDAKFITHAGSFHADDVMATVLLEILYEDVSLARVAEIDEKDTDAFVYDIGLGKYDHHQDDKVRRDLYNKVSTCRNILKSEGTLYTLQTNQTLNSYDVYKLGEAFQSNILNVCYATHLSYLNEKDIPPTYKNLGSLIQSNVNILSNQTMFALDEIKNNSSYYFNTNISSATIRNNLLSDYNIIASSYNEFAKMVLTLSEVLNEGGNDND